MGNRWRELSQLNLMTRLRDQYGIHSVLNAPYDHATDPEVDNLLFEEWTAWPSLEGSEEQPIFHIGPMPDLIWNFDFIQRDPTMLKRMIQLSKRYVLVFVPNRYNGGQLIHSLYHKLHGISCTHPEGGNPSLMTRRGTESLFRSHGLRVLESGGIDMPPYYFDYVVPLGNFLSTIDLSDPLATYARTPHLPIPKATLAFEELIKPLAFTWGHHIYCLGEKQDG